MLRKMRLLEVNTGYKYQPTFFTPFHHHEYSRACSGNEFIIIEIRE